MRSTIESWTLRWEGGIRRWIGLAGAPGFLAAVTSLLTLVGLSLVYRQLVPALAGSLAILLSLSDIFTLFALLGVWTVITRLYTPAHSSHFNWPADLRATAAYALPVVGPLTIGAIVLYDLPAASAVYLAAVTLLSTVLAASASMLNARGQHAFAAVALRFPNAAFVLLGLLYLVSPAPQTLTAAFGVHLGATALALLASIRRLKRVLVIGTERITGRQRMEGTAFMLSAVSDMGPEQGLVALAGRILPLRHVAAFAAIAVWLRPFRLLRNVLGTIFSPDVIRHRRSSYRRFFFGLWALALAAGAAAALAVPPIASWFYGDRHRQALPWIPFLALAGVIILGTLLPRVDLASRATMRTIRRFATTFAAAMLIGLAVSAYVLDSGGAGWLGPLVVMLQAIECAVGYGYWLGFRRGETAGAVASS